jgi:hypothetical protein
MIHRRRLASTPRTAAAPMTAYPRTWARRGLHTLLVLVFVVVQATALAHEVQHVLHLHDGPCGLHVAADHLAMAPAPEPGPALGLAPATEKLLPCLGARLMFPARLREARAPPFLS